MREIFFYIRFLVFFLSMIGGTNSLWAQKEIVEVKKADAPAEEATKVVINYDDEGGSEQEYRSSGFNRLFNNNAALSAGLASGAALINRSIQSLMDVVFYRLLDQELSYDMNDLSQFKFSINRELFPTSHGGFVVVDRFGLGPEYMKQLTKIQKVPLSLGIDGKVHVFDIYLTSDGTRLAQQADLPFYRRAINNWFGLLPFLGAVLPPSFNPNEMYNPMNLLETPFSFPVTVGGFREMPISSIRSYDISAGLNIPIDLFEFASDALKEKINRAEEIKASLPVSVFVEGQYRINVLRRSKNIAWVGLSRSKRVGARISAALGKVFRVMDKLILANWWTGVPVKFFPLDLESAKSKAEIYNQLYEFDFRQEPARKAYLKAVKGDFTLAMKLHKKRIKERRNNGVRFHFTRNEFADESSLKQSVNLILMSDRRSNIHTKSEIEIVDEVGKFYILRDNQEVQDIFMEAVTGRNKQEIHSRVEMKVVRVPDPDKKEPYVYTFDPKEKDPLKLIFSSRIQDGYTNAAEYGDYIDKLRYFSMLPLTSVPKIPRRQAKLISERIKRIAFSDPSNNVTNLQVPPTYLGKFNADGVVVITNKMVNEILSKDENQRWRAFATAYGLQNSDKNINQSRSKLTEAGDWLRYVSMRPASWFNLRVAEWDFIAEARNAMDALDEIEEAVTPFDKLDAFHRLFNSNYPGRVVRALLSLLDLNKVPRSVTFFTTARGKAGEEIKNSFKGLRNKVFRALTPFPPAERSVITEDKLNAFYPDDLRERRLQPAVSKIVMKMKPLPKDLPDYLNVTSQDRQREHVFVRLFVKNMSPLSPAKVYLKCEEAGRLQLGKFVLGEEVVNVAPLKPLESDKAKLGVLVYEFYLTGPLSPLAGMFFDNSIDVGGEFSLNLGVSSNGRVWSDEKNINFSLENGELVTPE